VRWIHEHVQEWGRTLFQGHVPSEEMVRYTERPGALPRERRKEIGRHLAVCEACERDLRMVEAVEPEVRDIRETRGFRFLGSAPAWAVAAILALVVPAAFGVRSWLGAPREGGVEPIRALVRLEAGEREGENAPRVALPGRGSVLLQAEVPIRDDPGVRYDARLEDGEGSAVWEVQDLRSVDEFGTFLIRVPEARLEPGRYRLWIEEVVDGSPGDEFRFRFEVVR
jgi:hypothetical protein